jgi:hypothetical protein
MRASGLVPGIAKSKPLVSRPAAGLARAASLEQSGRLPEDGNQELLHEGRLERRDY